MGARFGTRRVRQRDSTLALSMALRSIRMQGDEGSEGAIRNGEGKRLPMRHHLGSGWFLSPYGAVKYAIQEPGEIIHN